MQADQWHGAGTSTALLPLPRDFYARPSARSTVVLVVNMALVVAAPIAAYRIGSLPVWIAAFLLAGARAQSLYILQHECMHWLLFRSRRANNAWGMALSGFLGTELAWGRALHFRHHRFIGRDEDPNRFWHDTRVHPPGWPTLRFLLGQLFGMRMVRLALRVAGVRLPAPAVRPPLPTDTGQDHRRADMAVVLAAQAAVFACISLLAAPWVYVVGFWLPLATLTSFLEAVRSFSEHVLPGERAASPAEEARLFLMDAGRLERFFVSQFGFHLHHLHHLYPSVVTFELPRLHRWLQVHDPLYATRYVRRDGYVRTAVRYVLGRPLVPAIS